MVKSTTGLATGHWVFPLLVTREPLHLLTTIRPIRSSTLNVERAGDLMVVRLSHDNNAWSGCGYGYMPFANIIDPQKRLKFLTQTKFEVSEDMEVYGEFLWSKLETIYGDLLSAN